jgi:hypothetical protein
MKNLAGVKEADLTIKEELYLAGIEQVPAEAKGEVPYTIEGRIGNWRLRRAWYYWVVITELLTDGLPLKDAVELYEKTNPINPDKILGTSIRSGGDAGCSSPEDYTSQPVYDDELDEKLMALGYKKEYSNILKREYIPISVGEVARLCNEGKLDVQRYVDCYHIDDQIGLNEFAKFLNKK